MPPKRLITSAAAATALTATSIIGAIWSSDGVAFEAETPVHTSRKASLLHPPALAQVARREDQSIRDVTGPSDPVSLHPLEAVAAPGAAASIPAEDVIVAIATAEGPGKASQAFEALEKIQTGGLSASAITGAAAKSLARTASPTATARDFQSWPAYNGDKPDGTLQIASTVTSDAILSAAARVRGASADTFPGLSGAVAAGSASGPQGPKRSVPAIPLVTLPLPKPSAGAGATPASADDQQPVAPAPSLTPAQAAPPQVATGPSPAPQPLPSELSTKIGIARSAWGAVDLSLCLTPLPPQAVEALVEMHAQSLGADVALAKAIARAESGFGQNMISPVGALGVMQLMPATAADYGVRNPCDPSENIRGGIRFLTDLMLDLGNPMLVAGAYNAGPGAVYDAEGIPRNPETARFVVSVATEYYRLDAAVRRKKAWRSGLPAQPTMTAASGMQAQTIVAPSVPPAASQQPAMVQRRYNYDATQWAGSGTVMSYR